MHGGSATMARAPGGGCTVGMTSISDPVRRRPAVLSGAALGAALLCTGLMAGTFFAFTVSVMPGLGDGDATTFVTAMRHINAAIENGVFAVAFGGALIFPATAAVLLAVSGRRAAARWTLAATLLYLVVLVLTMGVEVPLNDRLAASGPADAAAVRERFAAVWVPVNDLRTLLTTLALGCLGAALRRHD